MRPGKCYKEPWYQCWGSSPAQVMFGLYELPLLLGYAVLGEELVVSQVSLHKVVEALHQSWMEPLSKSDGPKYEVKKILNSCLFCHKL